MQDVYYLKDKKSELINSLYTQFYELSFFKHKSLSAVFGLDIYFYDANRLFIIYYGLDSNDKYKYQFNYFEPEFVGKQIKNNVMIKTVYTTDQKEPTNIVLTYKGNKYMIPISKFENYTSAEIIKNELDIWILKNNNNSSGRSFIRDQYIQQLKDNAEK